MNYIMKKSLVIVIIIVCSLSSIAYAEAPQSEGANFGIEHFIFNEGTSWMFGTTWDIQRSNIGTGVINIVLSTNPDPPFYGLFQGFLYVSLFEPPLPDYQYDIGEVWAEEYPGGKTILESIWQNDPDPLFSWTIKVPGLEVLGYSVAFNEYPDELVDVTDEEYQTPDFYLEDGTHTFYVIAKNTSGNFGNAGSFEVWVDATRPEITNTLPENGATINESRPTMQGMLFDETSGIDPDSITFIITTELEEYTVSGDYDPETGLVVFQPDEDFQDGLVTVRLEVSDIAGNEAVPAFWSFIIDTVEPEGWIIINNDAPITDSPDVILNLFASEIITEVTQMILSNDGIFDTEEWEPYTTLKEDWTLPFIAGTRTVYVRFKDSADNESDVFSDSIILLMSVPNTFITDAPQSLTPETAASFSFTSTISNSQFQYKLDTNDWVEFTEESAAFFEDLPVGNHYFQVRAGIDLDNSGIIEINEIDPSPAVVSWTVGSLSAVPFEAKQPIRYYKRE